MRLWSFAERNIKELLRDPLNVFFGAVFPVLLLCILHIIERNVPNSPFSLESLTPGIAVFGLSFFSLFSGLLISKDRTSAFLQRLFATPMRAAEFIAGYALPLLPLTLFQCALVYTVSIILGLDVSIRIVPAVFCILPMAVFHISLGLLAGSLLNDKQVGGLCGALLTNCCAFLSDSWLPLSVMGKAFQGFANALPFVHAVETGRILLQGSDAPILGHITVICAYAAAISVLAVLFFRRKMRNP